MALSPKREYWSAHSCFLYDRDTWLPIASARIEVIQSFSVALTGELVLNTGGDSSYPHGAEPGLISTDISIECTEFQDAFYQYFLGADVTSSTSAETTGGVTTITNRNGSSVADGITGIASVAATGSDEGDLKDGLYVVKCVTATAPCTVDIYCLNDMDFLQGTDLTFVDDTYKVTSAAITIPNSGSTVADASLGLTFTGGSGTVSMTVDDTASFYVRKVNTGGYRTVDVGKSNITFPAFGLMANLGKQSNGTTQYAQFYNCRGVGMPINSTSKGFSSTTFNVTALRDTSLDKVFSMRETWMT